jgi:phytoene synthase
MARAGSENFPVASRVLPARVREDLLAIYGFARLVDELGDTAPGDRAAALDWLEGELDRAFAGEAEHPLLVRLQPTLARLGLAREPFVRLIEANRVDQRVTAYETWEQLRGYCALSANPVGELVLAVFGVEDPALVALSDSICTALQLVEHCQDVAEDLAAGRVYLPAEDLARFDCPRSDLGAARASVALRGVLAFEVERARSLLARGAPLLDRLPGRAKLAVAAFLAGGRAAADAIEAAGFDVLGGAPRAGRARMALALVRTLLGGMSATPEIEAAYRHCEAVTRTEAANFYWGIRLLPSARRQAMSAVYAFARRVDDIGDGELPPEEKLRLLDLAARDLTGAEAGHASTAAAADPVIVALADAHGRFSLPAGALGELIEGVRMDLEGVRYETFEQTVLYCRRVAGAIGRVCLAIFGLRDGVSAIPPQAEAMADDLGVALQLTNILRDVREDAGNGRVYLPVEDLRRFSLIGAGEEALAPARLAAVASAAERSGPEGEGGELDRLAALVHFEADRARQWFDRGMGLAPLLDRRSAACLLAMAGIYRRLLERIAEDPRAAAGRRTSLPAAEKAWVAVRGMLGVRR